ncbi:MAG TPA: VUT family protein [Thermomicrobiales bacterium]|nr:VUT family protein [Thermomicrobiales bacterium]
MSNQGPLAPNDPVYLRHAQTIGRIAIVAYVLTVVAANWAIDEFGTVSVGFGLTAPAGVYFAGLAFTLRDITHDTLGRWYVLAGIAVGSVISLLQSDNATIPGGVTSIAVASAAAFLLSETFDFAVYTPLRERHWIGAVVASNVVGLIADSVLFLWLAFGSLEFLGGQIVGKGWMTVAAVIVLVFWRRATRHLSS